MKRNKFYTKQIDGASNLVFMKAMCKQNLTAEDKKEIEELISKQKQKALKRSKNLNLSRQIQVTN